MADSYYQKLKNLVSAGRLSICLIVAPSRTSSSLVEHVIGNSSDIDNECHEPFLGARRDGFDPEEGYRQIYESAGGEFFENSSRKKSIVIKEMAHFIGKNDLSQVNAIGIKTALIGKNKNDNPDLCFDSASEFIEYFLK